METVKLAYVDQSRDCLDGNGFVFDEISAQSPSGKYETPARAYIGRFNFRAATEIIRRPAGRRRTRPSAHGQDALISGGNVLLLDMNIPARRPGNLLEDRMLEFAGSVLVISDRWFLDRAAHPWPAKAIPRLDLFAGNYQEYEQDKIKRLENKGPSRSASATGRSAARSLQAPESGMQKTRRSGSFLFPRYPAQGRISAELRVAAQAARQRSEG